ncbi:hypothetical protein [Hoeflea sp. TYP-13]|uniref:hypothetical protein n=1 Tax=Hoeflea sp. TYP-13 TaxID=3230023 RepID=UPI0034C6D8C5
MSGNKSAPNLVISALTGFGGADNGKNLCIGIRDQNGVDAVIVIPHVLEGEFFTHLSSASEYAAKDRSEQPPADSIAALKVDGFGIGKAPDGTAVIQMKFANGIGLNFALEEKTQAELRNILDIADDMTDLPDGTQHKKH